MVHDNSILMNPSAPGWIGKFGHLVKTGIPDYEEFSKVYLRLKETGFLYGINVSIPSFIVPEHTLSEDENAKINLLFGLYFTYRLRHRKGDYRSFVEAVLGFYQKLEIGSVSFLQKVLTGNKLTAQLEQLINSRIYLEDNVISKTFNASIANSLLFIDVLTFRAFLKGTGHIREYAQNLEYITINITYHALSSREKSRKDERLAQLFASSLTYIESTVENFDGSYRDQILDSLPKAESRYFLDVACLAVWEDKSLDYLESEFIFGLGKDLGLSPDRIALALADVTRFFHENASQVPYLKDHNLAVQFYDGMSRMVRRLILRNSKRLQRELSESRELVYLLSKSTRYELNAAEKKKVQNQLIDIFKSIPSLAIFILPGGAVLLPIFIKLIPKLLPSSFDENRVE